MTTVHVKKTHDKPESKEILAEAVVRISKALTALKEGGLNDEAIIVLVKDQTKLSKRAIRDVFWALRRLRGWYCR